MFESIRDKLFSTAEPSTVRPYDDKSGCNLNAGGTLLAKYQSEWIKLHDLNEENAKKAGEVDATVDQLVQSCERQWSSVSSLTSHLLSLSSLKDSIHELTNKVETLEKSFEDVEKSLVTLGNVIEVQKLQEQQLDERFHLALYKEKKMSEFELYKVKLETEHENRVRRFQAHQQSLREERQEAFQVAFEEEMEHYKQHGHIEKVASVLGSEQRNLKLEDVDLDQENNVLEDFFAAEATEFEFPHAGDDAESNELTTSNEADGQH